MGILNGGLLNRPGDGGTTTTTGSGITETEARALIADWAEQGHARPSVGFLVSVERTMAIQPESGYAFRGFSGSYDWSK